MKQYKFEVVINEGQDEFWDDINNRKVTGCDDVLEAIRSILNNNGFIDDDDNCVVKLSGFKELPW